jgi:hypothetical protein
MEQIPASVGSHPKEAVIRSNVHQTHKSSELKRHSKAIPKAFTMLAKAKNRHSIATCVRISSGCEGSFPRQWKTIYATGKQAS